MPARARQLIIAVDFDGTVVEHLYPDVGLPVPGAIRWLKIWQAAGADLILYTMRGGRELEDAVEWYRINEIPLFGVNTNPEQRSWTQSPKAYAQLYVDDAAFGCPLVDGSLCRPHVNWDIIGPAVFKMLGVATSPRLCI